MDAEDKDKKIQVAVRCRPLHDKKERFDHKCITRVDTKGLVMAKAQSEGDDGKSESHTFSFDFFFDETEQQIDVYNEAVLDLVDSTLDGHNSTIFAYGQTGSGKTFTTLGAIDDEGGKVGVGTHSGIFLRVLTDFFLYKERSAETLHVHIMLSIIEIYRDEVKDLLNKKKVLKVREVGEDATMEGLTLEEVFNLRDVYSFFKIANACRSVASTAMNDASSRSHAVFMIDLVQQAKTPANPTPEDAEAVRGVIRGETKLLKGENPLRRSRICIVDLAGSERLKKSKVEGQEKLEAIAINKSLTTLGLVIKGLYDGQKHLPYRDARLTRILRSYFSDPNCKVLLCANISPTVNSFSETKSTLGFANNVKGIKAQAVSVDPQAEMDYMKQFKKLEELCGDLRIASVKHDFVLQSPELIYAQEATDDAARARLVNHVVEKYRDGVSVRIKQKEEEERRMVEELVEQLTKAKLAELEQTRKRVQESIVAEEKNREELGAELLRTEAGKKAEVVEKQEATKALKQAKRESAEVIARLEGQTRGLREQLKEASSQTFGSVGVDDAETRRIVSQELERSAGMEQYHRSTDEFAKKIVELRTLQVDHFRNAKAMLPGAEKRHALDALVHKNALVRPFCENVVSWMCEVAMRTSEKQSSPDDRESCEHLTRLLPFEHAAGGSNLTPGCFADRSEAPGATVVYEPSPDDYEDDDEVVTSMQTVREAAASAVNLSFSQVSAAMPPLGEKGLSGLGAAATADEPCVSDPLKIELFMARKQVVEPARRKVEAAETSRRQAMDVQIRELVYRCVGGSKPAPDALAKADRTYLQSLYDAQGMSSTCDLDGDCVRYCQHGSYLIKHGRSGQPRKRRFWISSDKTALCWTNDTVMQSRRCSLALKEVSGIVLGQYSKIFARQQASPTSPGFAESFSLVLRQQHTTLDLVAESRADMEVWTLAIAALTGFEPVWGGAADEGLYAKAKEYVAGRVQEVQTAAERDADPVKLLSLLGGTHVPAVDETEDRDCLYITKGELRVALNTDIYRTISVWNRLEQEGLVYDQFGSERRWPHTSCTVGL
eukprot:TRINITY_DN82_c0_g1_i2.p1 TRINITY_DN82_c0_g1~~TRINITY_DN82_c0_g1_i2.p1  ORF type:complete len:1082 (+),score=429.76 TRINITY_DN82_c0_g1_i2:61-3246(+)